MGQRLKELFAKADALGGLRAKIRLATLVKLTSTQAEIAPDEAPIVERVQRGLEQISRELGIIPAAPRVDIAVVTPRENRLRFLQTTSELLAQRSLYLGDVNTTIARMMEAAAVTLEVARASVWMYDSERLVIRCADLFLWSEGRHESGAELNARDYPDYFTALKRERTIAATNAHTDPRTSTFSNGYLGPLGIGAMLDVPIWVSGHMIGVICHEHVGGDRHWTEEEEAFAGVLANLIALAIETSKNVQDAAQNTVH